MNRSWVKSEKEDSPVPDFADAKPSQVGRFPTLNPGYTCSSGYTCCSCYACLNIELDKALELKRKAGATKVRRRRSRWRSAST